MAEPRKLPAWLLIVATTVLGVALAAVEAADWFPLWRFAVEWTPQALPSTSAVPSKEVASGRPILSLTVNEFDLRDEKTGILANKQEHGVEWEREGSMSYFDEGRLLFGSGVGVRIHGGGSRITAPKPGFRLYFRRKYGPRELPPGILFSNAAQPVRRLVIHDDVRRTGNVDWYFVNPLAYDIARAVGAIAPETKPVRFYLNGEYYGPFVVTERFDQRFFAAHWGYDDIVLSQDEMNTLADWVRSTRPLTVKNVSEHVDLENLTRWFVAVAFCATRDAYQGPGQLLDATRKPGWFWVNWDMDQSFRDWNHDTFQYLLNRVGEGRRGRNPAEPRAIILTNLIAEDAVYRDYLKRVIQKALNHQLTTAFLMERYEHYLETAMQLEIRRLNYLPQLRRFLERRRNFFRLISEQWLNTSPSQQVSVVAPPGVEILIEGERVRNGYRGMYFPDVELTADVSQEHARRFSGWRINAIPQGGAGPLKFKADRPIQLEAVFGQPLTTERATPAADTPAQVPAAAHLVWRRIPSGKSWMGCVPGDDECGDAEKPRVQIEFTQPFEMLDREVTTNNFRAYAAAMSRDVPRQPEWYADGTHPVVNVTWDEAQAYCGWAGGRLPSEEEWEYAARGGVDTNVFPWGNEFTGQANGRHRFATEAFDWTAPAGSFAPNGYGLHDMAGNIWEWTASEFTPSHAKGPERRGYDERTIKGGGFDNLAPRSRVSERRALSKSGRHNLNVGFRCVKGPESLVRTRR
jgi:formylglycine-generating enzyme required for sulfatase activity